MQGYFTHATQVSTLACSSTRTLGGNRIQAIDFMLFYRVFLENPNEIQLKQHNEKVRSAYFSISHWLLMRYAPALLEQKLHNPDIHL